MSECILFDKLKEFAQSLMVLIEGYNPQAVCRIRTHLAKRVFEAHTYYDGFLEFFAHKSWMLLTRTKREKLQRLKDWIEFILSLHTSDEPLQTILNLKQILLKISCDEKWLDYAYKQACYGFLGELSALYCFIYNDYEVAPLSFIQWTSQGRAIGDLILINANNHSKNLSKDVCFIDITTDEKELRRKLSRSSRKKSITSYYGYVPIDYLLQGKVFLTIYNLKGKKRSLS